MTFPAFRWTQPAAIVAALFGWLSIIKGGLQIVSPEAVQRLSGESLTHIVMFNAMAGFAYLGGAWALWENRPSASWIALSIGIATLVVLSGYLVTVESGEPVDARTAATLPIRAAFWLLVAWACRPRRVAGRYGRRQGGPESGF